MCVVPGNHDVETDPGAVAVAADRTPGVFGLGPASVALGANVRAVGLALSSADGGATCTGIELPHVDAQAGGLLVWATHYPIVSVESRLHARGLRYPDDLINRPEVQNAALESAVPTLVLHGHVHSAVDLFHQLLQIGCAALVEWPHVWTLVTIAVQDGMIEVAAERRPVEQASPPPIQDTTFTSARARWRHSGGGWQRTLCDQEQ